MKIVYLLAFVLVYSNLLAQNPGNVGLANLTAWFKPDALSLGNVTSWTTSYPVGGITVTDGLTPYPQATNTPVGAISNYNTTIEFVNNSFAGMSTATLKAFSNTGALNLLDNSNSGDQGTMFCAYVTPVANTNGHYLMYNETSDAIQLRNLGTTGRLALGKTGASTNGTRDWLEMNRPTIISYSGNKSSTTSMTGMQNRLNLPTATISSQSSGTNGLYIGYAPTIATSAYNGYVHEYIFYNRDLNVAEITAVHTYLAIKYGITLHNSLGGTQGDYVGTNGAIVWDASVNPSYHNDVIGLARDDSEALLQKQSHSFDDITRVSLSSLQVNNISNSGIFSANNSYITIGHNNGNMCATTSSNLEKPASCNLYSRLEREWKVTKTNFSESCSMDFALNACALPGSVSTSDLRFLVDDDGNFSNGGTTCYFNGDGSGITISYANPRVTISGISNLHLANNSTFYVTIGSIQSITPLPISLISFDAIKVSDHLVDLEWETANELQVETFTIERSNNGLDWDLLATIHATGSEFSGKKYKTQDEKPFFPISYYRLLEIDNDGVASNKGVRVVSFDSTPDDSVILYPNPTSGSVTIESKNELFPEAIRLFSSIGEPCNLVFHSMTDFSGILDLSKLPAGVYLLQINEKMHKIIKN